MANCPLLMFPRCTGRGHIVLGMVKKVIDGRDPNPLGEPRLRSGRGSNFSRHRDQNYVGGNNPGGAATAGLDWTISGVGCGAPQASRRRKYRRIRTAIARGLPAP